jgi:hypothetical protein
MQIYSQSRYLFAMFDKCVKGIDIRRRKDLQMFRVRSSLNRSSAMHHTRPPYPSLNVSVNKYEHFTNECKGFTNACGFSICNVNFSHVTVAQF